MPIVLVAALVLAAIVVAAQWSLWRLRRALDQPHHVRAGQDGLGGLLRPFRVAVGLAVTVDALAVVAGLAAPWPVKAVVDNVTSGRVSAPFGFAGAHRMIAAAVVAGVALVCALCLLDYLSAVLSETIGASVGLRVRQAVFTKLVRLPASFSRRHANGDLVTRLTIDVSRVQDAILDRWRVVVPNLVAMAGMVTLMALLSPRLAAVTAALAPLMGLAFWLRRRTVAQVQRTARSRSGDLAARVGEVARNLPAVQVFGREAHESERLETAGRVAAMASVRAVMASARLSPIADLVIACNLAVVLAMGAAEIRAHQLSVGGLVVFLIYLGALQQPVRAFSRLSYTLGAGTASRERLDGILHTPELRSSTGNNTLGPGAPVVATHHLSYHYGDGRQALADVSLCIPAGEITTIVGENGAGKSTLLSLLVRLDDPSAGVITINGIDIRGYNLDSLRQQVALVPQDVWLTDGSLEENVAYGAPTATREQIQAAARLARVDEFLERLPSGWATSLGEGGTALSGGERRRVALARAILRDCPLLLLDEPTSGLDRDAQRVVVDAIRRASRGRTTVIVTHNPELAAIGNHTVVLSAGSVATAASVPTPGRNLNPVPLP